MASLTRSRNSTFSGRLNSSLVLPNSEPNSSSGTSRIASSSSKLILPVYLKSSGSGQEGESKMAAESRLRSGMVRIMASVRPSAVRKKDRSCEGRVMIGLSAWIARGSSIQAQSIRREAQ